MPAIARHGTPITGLASPDGTYLDVIQAAGPRDFIASYYRPDQVEWLDGHSRSWAGDCGTFSFWQAALKSGVQPETVFSREYLDGYYAWSRRWCLGGSGRCKWVVIPDPIGTGTQELDALLREWPVELRDFGVPVYHLDEPIERAVALLRQRAARPPGSDVPWICIGATGEFKDIGSQAFRDRLDELFNAIMAEFGCIPPVHFFRALQLLKGEFDYPVWSVDSADRARNHNRLRPYAERYLWAVRQTFDRWDNLALLRTQQWPPMRLIKQPDLYGEAA
jgi:hypothetical protein